MKEGATINRSFSTATGIIVTYDFATVNSAIFVTYDNVWSAAVLQEELRAESTVCVNVFGLLVEDFSPGHDDDPRVLVLISRTVLRDLYRKQVLQHAV